MTDIFISLCLFTQYLNFTLGNLCANISQPKFITHTPLFVYNFASMNEYMCGWVVCERERGRQDSSKYL